MNNEANQFENFKYSQEIKELLNINLSNDDLNNLDHIYNYYDSKNIQRDYEDLIEDIYIFIFKRNLSITQLAEIYKVNQRIIKRTWNGQAFGSWKRHSFCWKIKF